MKQKKFYTTVDPEFKEIFDKKTVAAKRIVISSHLAPDDDSISSTLSVYYYLANYLKLDVSKINIFYTGEPTQQWSYFTNFEKIHFVDDIANYIIDDDLVILVDGSGWTRFSRIEKIKEFSGEVICIDHHPTPADLFDLHIVVKELTSTSETIYRIFFEKLELNPQISQIILLGILGDTGNFKFINPRQADVLQIANRLVKEGNIEIQTLQSKYQYIPTELFSALVELMNNSKTYDLANWPPFLVSYLDYKYVKKHNLDDNQISEVSGLFTQYLTKVQHVAWGFVMTPRLHDSTYSISLRSLPNSVNVRIIMEQTKLGGGHDRASGGKIRTDNRKDAMKKVFDYIEHNLPSFS